MDPARTRHGPTDPRLKSLRRGGRRRPRRPAFLKPLEVLEDRFLLSTLLVANPGDGGPQSLRQAILQAHDGDNIRFAPSLAGQTITLADGGLVLDKDLTITGLGADRLTIRGVASGGSVFTITCGATVSISGLTIAGGQAASGGGIFNAGNLTLADSSLQDNQATGSGGGLFNAGTLTVTGCTFAGNQALGVPIPNSESGSLGGGGLFDNPGASATIVNTTFSGNRAVGNGGAIFNHFASLHLINVTIAGNQAEAGENQPCGGIGGGIFQSTTCFCGCAPDVDIQNTIIAGNTAAVDPDVRGAFDSLGHNLIGNTEGSKGFAAAANDLLNIDPQLGPLQNNGGPTPTLALLEGSPAIDAGDNTAPVPATDQRGFPRFVNNIIDIGAFEFQPAAVVALTGSPDPSVTGQAVTFRATLGLAPQSGTPTGTITFFDGDTALKSVPLNGLTAAFSTSNLAVGSHTITAVYSGDDRFPSGTSVALVQKVNPAGTSTTLQSSDQPSVLGQAVTFNATVLVQAPGAGTPTGMVRFQDGDTVLGEAPLVDGQATLGTAALALGTHSISATYEGDPSFDPSTSAVLDQQVNPVSTTLVVTPSVNPSVFGQPVKFTVTVTPSNPGMGTPTGMVLFKEGDTTLGTGPVDDAGQATFSTSQLVPGTHSITAVYSGDNIFQGSSTGLDLLVNRASTATAVDFPADPLSPGQAVTLTATVAAQAPGAGNPTGTVTFQDDTTPLGTAPLIDGMASLTLSSLAPGNHTITAVYNGDADFLVSTSAASTLTQLDAELDAGPPPVTPAVIPGTLGSAGQTAAVFNSSHTGVVTPPPTTLAVLPLTEAAGASEALLSSTVGLPSSEAPVARILPAEGGQQTYHGKVPVSLDDSTRTTPFRGSTAPPLHSPASDSQSTSSQAGIEIGGQTGTPLPEKKDEKPSPNSKATPEPGSRRDGAADESGQEASGGNPPSVQASGENQPSVANPAHSPMPVGFFSLEEVGIPSAEWFLEGQRKVSALRGANASPVAPTQPFEDGPAIADRDRPWLTDHPEIPGEAGKEIHSGWLLPAALLTLLRTDLPTPDEEEDAEEPWPAS